MFKILVCVDGSQRAEGALPYARACAWMAGPETEVVLVQVPEPFSLTPPEVYAQLLAALTEQVELYLESLAVRLRELGCPASTRVPRGPICDSLLDLAQAEQVGLIVITSHGRTGPGRWLLGSVAEKLARHSPVPVLLIPQAAVNPMAWDRAELPTLARVVIPADGSALSESALRLAELVPLRPEHVHLVMGSEASSRPEEPIDDLLARDEAYLQGLARRLQCEVSIRACDRTPAEAILFVARDVCADLIAMATQGRGGLTRLMLGSVAEKVARSATCPVLLINPRCLETTRREAPWLKQAPEAPSTASGTASTSTGSKS